MDPHIAQAEIPLDCAGSRATVMARLCQFVENEAEPLLGTLRHYIFRSGLASGEAVAGAALELLNEVVIEALEHADRFDPSRSPRAWLLAISANLIKRKLTSQAKQARREQHQDDLHTVDYNLINDGDLFDRLASLCIPEPSHDLESKEQVAAILALVSPSDQQVLSLALLHDLDGVTLAQKLGISPGAARVRFHRALQRLREAWHTQARGHGQ